MKVVHKVYMKRRGFDCDKISAHYKDGEKNEGKKGYGV